MPVFGPSKSAARLEGSEIFHEGPVRQVRDPDGGVRQVYRRRRRRNTSNPGRTIVVKTDGLAAGKGVIVALELDNALNAVDDMLSGALFGSAGEEIVVEEFLGNEEAWFWPSCVGM